MCHINEGVLFAAYPIEKIKAKAKAKGINGYALRQICNISGYSLVTNL